MNTKLLLTAVSLLLCLFSINSQASLIRYDVTLSFGAGSEVASGFLVFNETTSVPGNIWPDVVDWRFVSDGFVFSPFNTQALDPDTIKLSVDGDYNIVSDFDLALALTGQDPAPCFTSTTSCFTGSGLSIGFTRDFNGFTVRHPGAFYFAPAGVGRVEYSDPIPVVVPLPASAPLVLLALMALVLMRWRLSRLVPRRKLVWTGS